MNLRVASLLPLSLSTLALASQTTRLPDPQRLLAATVSGAPIGMKETARSSHLSPIRYTSHFIKRIVKDPRSLDANAVLCDTSWSFPSPRYQIPGHLQLMWGVYDTVESAKFAALSKTWGPKALPPASSFLSGSFSGGPVGFQSWHTMTDSYATIVAQQDQIVVQLVVRGASNPGGRGGIFEPLTDKQLKLLEAIAKQTIAKTEGFLRQKH